MQLRFSPKWGLENGREKISKIIIKHISSKNQKKYLAGSNFELLAPKKRRCLHQQSGEKWGLAESLISTLINLLRRPESPVARMTPG
jgi:hypothetical protein